MGQYGYPTQSLKNLHRRKGGGCLGRYIKIYGALGTLYAKQTFNPIAANDCSEPIVSDAAFRTGDRNKLGATIDYLIVVPRVSSDLDILAG